MGERDHRMRRRLSLCPAAARQRKWRFHPDCRPVSVAAVEPRGKEALSLHPAKPSCLVMAAISTAPPTDFGRRTANTDESRSWSRPGTARGRSRPGSAWRGRRASRRGPSPGSPAACGVCGATPYRTGIADVEARPRMRRLRASYWPSHSTPKLFSSMICRAGGQACSVRLTSQTSASGRPRNSRRCEAGCWSNPDRPWPFPRTERSAAARRPARACSVPGRAATRHRPGRDR